MHDSAEDGPRSGPRPAQAGPDEALRRIAECEVQTAVTATKLHAIEERIAHFVTMAEFLPVKWIIYGGIGTTLAAVLTALMAGILSNTTHTLVR